MAELVPIIRHEIPTVTNSELQLARVLGQCLRLEIPGFKVEPPARLATFARQRHEATVRDVCATLAMLYPDRAPRTDTYGNATLNQRPIGDLHHDLYDTDDPTLSSTAFDVNTCLQGNGTVWLSHFGTDPAASKDNTTLAHNQLMLGHVDPKLVNPNVFVGNVTQGDTVVWTEGGFATAWHRFDTIPGADPRQSTLTLIYAHDGSGSDNDEVNYPVTKSGIL